MANADQTIDEFFDRYGGALLARDAKTIAQMYAVPALILSPASRYR